MFRAKLQFQDGGVVMLDVPADQNLAEAALEQDVPLRSDCLSGSCGTCIAQCHSGAVDLDDGAEAIVTQDERAEGIYPSCLTRLKSDAVFELPYPLADVPDAPGRHRGTLQVIERLASNVFRLVIRLQDVEGLRFQPGQYLRLRPPGLRVARAYSIASSPAQLPDVELLIRHLPGGQVSDWLESDAAVPGAVMTLQGPSGGFALDDRAPRAVMIAGGTGLAPMLSFIRAQMDRAASDQVPMLLCFGCTRPEEMFMAEELTALAEALPGLEVRIGLMQGGDDRFQTGTAVALLGDQIDADASYHLCGPPAMVTAARDVLRAAGVPSGKIRAERFGVGA